MVPNLFACLCKSSIISGPDTPSGYPGKFSTSDVVISCPPIAHPVIKMGSSIARAVYIALPTAAGPLPTIHTLCTFVDIFCLGYLNYTLGIFFF